MARCADCPLTDARRRALVRSALGATAYRVPAARVVMIADDAARLRLDARATSAHAVRWGKACRQALDAGRPLPDVLPLDDGAASAVGGVFALSSSS